MTNPWIEHIKKYAKDNNISYGCALSTPECKNTYRKPSSTPKQKTECKNCKKNKEPHKMYKEPIGPKQINPFNNENHPFKNWETYPRPNDNYNKKFNINRNKISYMYNNPLRTEPLYRQYQVENFVPNKKYDWLNRKRMSKVREDEYKRNEIFDFLDSFDKEKELNKIKTKTKSKKM